MKITTFLIIMSIYSLYLEGHSPTLSTITIKTISFTDKSVYSEIDNINNEILILIPLNSTLEIDKISLNITFSEYANSNIIPDKEYDLTKPFKLLIIAKDGTVTNYKIIARKCVRERIAVIVSDTQVDIIPLYRQDAFFLNLNKILYKANKANVPIYYIMLSALKGTKKWELPTQLEYQNGTIVDKPNTVNAFEVESFYADLLKKGVGTIYIVGVSSMGCVKGTSLGAIQNKFNLYLVADAHSEPIGYRTEESIDECNNYFKENPDVTLITTNKVDFNK